MEERRDLTACSRYFVKSRKKVGFVDSFPLRAAVEDRARDMVNLRLSAACGGGRVKFGRFIDASLGVSEETGARKQSFDSKFD